MKIQGKYACAETMIDNIDPECISQILDVCNQEIFKDSKIRIMPDTHCFSGNVIPLTLDNQRRTFRQLYESGIKSVYTLSLNEDGDFIPVKANVVYGGEKEVMKIVLDNNQEIVCTLDHKFMLRNGEYVKAKDLKENISLMPINYYKNSEQDYMFSKYWFKGKLHRGGQIHRLVAKHFLDNFELLNQKDMHVHHIDHNHFNNVPENLKILTRSEHSRIHANEGNGWGERYKDSAYRERRKIYMKTRKITEKMRQASGNILRKFNLENKELLDERRKKARKKLSELFKNNISFKEDFNKKCKIGKIKKIANLCILKYNQVNREFYEKTRYSQNFPNAWYGWDKAVKILSENNLNFNDITKGINHKVVSIEFLKTKEDVFCLEVLKYENFCLDAGIVVHNSGKGCVIGFTAYIKDRVIPNLVGVDISCSISTYKLDTKEVDFEKLDNIIREYIPSGLAVRSSISNLVSQELKEKIYKVCNSIEDRDSYERHLKSIGSLGSGNHFIELNKDKDGYLWLSIHCGSRNFGKKICDFHQKKAIKYCEEKIKKEKEFNLSKISPKDRQEYISTHKSKELKISPELSYLEGEDLDLYTEHMNVAEEFATINHKVIVHEICSHMGWNIIDSIFTHHNYIEFLGNRKMIIRKGAISAKKGERIIIPINMRDGSIIGIGKGNKEWNESAPHGAGRVLSRGEAKKTLNLDNFKKTMEGIWSTSILESTLDEAPSAYKSLDTIKNSIGDVVDIVDIIKPVYNFKAN